MAALIKYIPSQSGELSLQWVADEFTRISSVLNEGLTIEDEGVILETSADTLNFVGSGVVASGTGSEKTITISGGGGGSDLTIKDEGSALPTAATTLDFVGDGVVATGSGTEKTITIAGGGGGVTAHSALTGLTGSDDHTQYLHKDTTRNVSVGYTCDVEADTITSGTPDTLTPDLTLEHLKTVSVTDDFTLEEPSDTGGCEYYLDVSSGGPFTITEGTGVTLIGGISNLAASTTYILNVRRFGALKTVAQLVTL